MSEFEVGKKYVLDKSLLGHYPPRPYLCVHVGKSRAILVDVETERDLSLLLSTRGNYEEYAEPKKAVAYINAYPSGTVYGEYKTRADADLCAGRDRMACKRVEITEGEFDD